MNEPRRLELREELLDNAELDCFPTRAVKRIAIVDQDLTFVVGLNGPNIAS